MGKVVVAIVLVLWVLANSSLTECAPLVSEEFTLAGVCPGMTREAIRSKLGKGRDVPDKNLALFRLSDGNEVLVLFNSHGVAETVSVAWETPSAIVRIENLKGEDKVSFGMTKALLKQRLGKPNSVRTIATLTHWTYAKFHLSVALSKGAVVGASLSSD